VGRLDGKIALITGAARGQGESHARAFVAEGAKVVVADLLEEEGRAVADSLGENALFVMLDVTDEASWHEAVAEAVDRFGALNGLVNNAGISIGAPLLETTIDNFTLHFRVNQLGPFLGIQACAPAMIESGGGSIVNVSSIAGTLAPRSTVAYSASKSALRAITKAAAVELGPRGIRANTVLPGLIRTPMTRFAPEETTAVQRAMIPIGRPAEPEEVSPLVVYLVSDESGYLNGAEIAFDGGVTAALWPGAALLSPTAPH
jgi:3alpha(or 20beta)-hydroxysteroid dehydrogenase